ncbi:MAG: ATP-binding protein [Anaerolineae bacterium]|nr:ATP-binding protein [Anaerolineae bacterium]
MRIAVASGKGGTGKTTVAINLILSIAQLPEIDRPAKLVFLDCDVEEPNAHLFLNPDLTRQEEVGIQLPEVDFTKCTFCGKCAEVCVYHAIAVLGQQVLVFPQLCHGCGSCTYNCPEQAIHEVLKPTGKLEWGTRTIDGTILQFGRGVMNIGEAMATPIIHQLKSQALKDIPLVNGTNNQDGLAILDAPPGNACPVVETMRDMDFVVLVTEPTPFGLHDLRVAVQVARDELKLPVGVVINRDGVGDDSVTQFCADEGVPVLMRIPLDRRIAEAYAEGIPLVEAQPDYQEAFIALYQRIKKEVTA